jgi:hypothetical protein
MLAIQAKFLETLPEEADRQFATNISNTMLA